MFALLKSRGTSTWHYKNGPHQKPFVRLWSVQFVVSQEHFQNQKFRTARGPVVVQPATLGNTQRCAVWLRGLESKFTQRARTRTHLAKICWNHQQQNCTTLLREEIFFVHPLLCPHSCSLIVQNGYQKCARLMVYVHAIDRYSAALTPLTVTPCLTLTKKHCVT